MKTSKINKIKDRIRQLTDAGFTVEVYNGNTHLVINGIYNFYPTSDKFFRRYVTPVVVERGFDLFMKRMEEAGRTVTKTNIKKPGFPVAGVGNSKMIALNRKIASGELFY